MRLSTVHNVIVRLHRGFYVIRPCLPLQAPRFLRGRSYLSTLMATSGFDWLAPIIVTNETGKTHTTSHHIQPPDSSAQTSGSSSKKKKLRP